MKFILSPTDRYWWPVIVRIPDPQNPGQILEQTFKAEFEPLTPEEESRAAEVAAGLNSMREILDHSIAQAARVVKNWDGVVDELANPVPFSPEMLRLALGKTWFRIGVNEAYQQSLKGEAARLGN